MAQRIQDTKSYEPCDFESLGEPMDGFPGERRLYVDAANEADARAAVAERFPDLEVTYAEWYKDGVVSVCVQVKGL